MGQISFRLNWSDEERSLGSQWSSGSLSTVFIEGPLKCLPRVDWPGETGQVSTFCSDCLVSTGSHLGITIYHSVLNCNIRPFQVVWRAGRWRRPGWLSITYRQIGGAGGGGPGPRQAGMPRPAVQQGAPHQLHIGILGREERGITGRIIRGDCDYCHVGNYI